MRMILSLLLLALPVTALAQPSKTADVSTMATDDCARARKAGKTCVLSIDSEDVTGTTPTNGDPPLVFRTDGKQASLIRIRRDFIPEILKSAEDID
jgi:hypothetical protein